MNWLAKKSQGENTEIPNQCDWCAREELKARGLCNVCYKLLLRLQKIEEWNLDEVTWPRFLKWFKIQPGFKGNEEKLKMATTRALERLIEYRKHLGISLRQENISGIDLEHLIRNLFSRIRGTRRGKLSDEYYHTADFFDRRFSYEQKLDLYRFLKRAFYSIPMENLTQLVIEEYYVEDSGGEK